MPMRILIAEDENPARAELRWILEQLESEAEFVEARNGREALRLFAEQPLDVVFLDINMPGLNGLAVADALLQQSDSPPLIVFATAYDAHAVRAFELAALDYVVKPFQQQRLAETMERVRQALAVREQRDLHESAVRTYLQSAAAEGALTKLWAERADKTAVLVDYADIFWIEAQRKKVWLYTAVGEKFAVRYSLKELEARLAKHGVVRVHKGYLANLNHVAEVVPWFSDTYQLHMADDANTEIPMSRQYGAVLKKLTGG